MTLFRPFRNTDPPALRQLWNRALQGRGTAPFPSVTLFDHFLLAKAYFDPHGLIVAEADGKLLGWALAAFGPAVTPFRLDYTQGVICLVAVDPEHRRQGLGSELLHRCETYLRERGAKQVYAGALPPLNPYLFGVYGGSNTPGFLRSDLTVHAFLTARGYEVCDTVSVRQRLLDRPFNVIDPRFPNLRRRYEVQLLPRRGTQGWYSECVCGPIEMEHFRLEERETGQPVGSLHLWEMEPYTQHWNEHAVGVLDMVIDEPLRRQGLGKFLLAQVMRHYCDQYCTMIEMQVNASDATGMAFLTHLGFAEADQGHRYCKTGLS